MASPPPEPSSTTKRGKENSKGEKTCNSTGENQNGVQSNLRSDPIQVLQQQDGTCEPVMTGPGMEGLTQPMNGLSNDTINIENEQSPDGTPSIPPGSTLPPSTPADAWHLAYTELRAMGKRMNQLDKIERDVESLKNQMGTVSKKTEHLENCIQNHYTDINYLKSAVGEIKTSIKKHDESVAKLWTFVGDIATKTDQRVREIKQAIQENINQIGQLANIKTDIRKEVSTMIRESTQTIKTEIKTELSEQITKSSQTTKEDFNNTINRHAHDVAYKALQDQAYFNRHNLVLLGMQEQGQDSAFTQATKLFKSELKLSNLSVDVAYRMGKPPAQGSSYSRPIVVKFSKISSRNSVWKKRNDISRNDRSKYVLQADLPKQLREDLQILYRVQRAAIKSNQYQTAEVKNYKLYLDGEDFAAWELEELPIPFRPSTLATRESQDSLAFYSKHSPLSNHHPSPFEVRGRSYANMEQYLAYKKARLSGQKSFINRALLAHDPVEAKSILHALKTDHPEEWKKDISAIATEGLQAKFRQNSALEDYLCNTAPLTLGEASRNPQWGVGFTLDEEEIVDKSKWNKQGNLLGRLLMKVRNQIIHERQTRAAADLEQKHSKHSPPADQSIAKTDSHPKTTGNAPVKTPSNQDKRAAQTTAPQPKKDKLSGK